jgi:hypothetical protein
MEGFDRDDVLRAVDAATVRRVGRDVDHLPGPHHLRLVADDELERPLDHDDDLLLWMPVDREVDAGERAEDAERAA